MNHPPYHLRINKAVDRLLLVNMMRALLPEPKKCAYYGMGGPFLEDLRLIDYIFPQIKLESIDNRLQTIKRQEFHRFRRDLQLTQSDVGRFISSYDPDDKPEEVAVFWLDYTGLGVASLTDFGSLLKKVPLGSIARITLRAEPDKSLQHLEGHLSEQSLNNVRALKDQKFRDRWQSYLSAGYESDCVSHAVFARTVQLMVRNAISQALDTSGSTRDFLHIHSVRYSDDTQMLSITGVIYDRNKSESSPPPKLAREFFVEKLQDIPNVNFDWDKEPENIDIPALTLKERMKLEEHFPLPDGNQGKFLSDQLGYEIYSETEDPERLLQYAKFYREYPNFIRATF